MKHKKITILNGDDAAGYWTTQVAEKIFGHLPFDLIDFGVDSRVSTGDTILNVGVESLMKNGTGFKCSTASAHPKLKSAGILSINKRLRQLLGVYLMERGTVGAGKYPNPMYSFRFGMGGIYSEDSFIEEQPGIYRASFTIDERLLRMFAAVSYQRINELGLTPILTGKFTIAESEKFFERVVQDVWEACSGDTIPKNQVHLSDSAIAQLPHRIASGKGYFARGGFGFLNNCLDGDYFTDVIELQHAFGSLGSKVYCSPEPGAEFTFWELPLGTAEKLFGTNYKGKNFYNFLPIIYGIGEAFIAIDPDHSVWVNSVTQSAEHYLVQTKPARRSSHEMIDYILR